MIFTMLAFMGTTLVPLIIILELSDSTTETGLSVLDAANFGPFGLAIGVLTLVLSLSYLLSRFLNRRREF